MVDYFAFAIRLEIFDFSVGEFLMYFVETFLKRGGPVYFRLALAEQVKVWADDNADHMFRLLSLGVSGV